MGDWDWNNFLKVISMLAAGFFGALGLITQYKDDSGKITKWGRIALVGILFSSAISLTLHYLETAKAKEAAKIAQQEAEIAKENANAQAKKLEDIQVNAKTVADQQERSLKEIQTLKEGLDESLQQQKRNVEITGEVAKGMKMSVAAQQVLLAGNRKISGNLSEAVNSLAQTSKITYEVLEETVDRIDSIEVRLFILLDPLAVKDASGKSILSSESLKLLERYKSGEIDLSDSRKAALVAEFNRHYDVIRNHVFSGWVVRAALDKEQEDDENEAWWALDMPEMFIYHQGETGVSNFFIIDFSDLEEDENRAERGIACVITYLIPPNRYAGFRKYTDLNGTLWTVEVETKHDGLKLGGAFLSTGGLLPLLEMSKEEIKSPETREFRGSKVIPKNHFKRQGIASKQ